MYCCSLASEPVITYWNLKYGPTETNRQNRPRNKNRRPCQELIFFNYNLKNRQIISKYVPLVDNPVLLIKLTDLPVKYGRKQLRKANTRTTLGHESPILNWRDGALISFTTFKIQNTFKWFFIRKNSSNCCRIWRKLQACLLSALNHKPNWNWVASSCFEVSTTANGSRRRSRRLSAGDPRTLALNCSAVPEQFFERARSLFLRICTRKLS